MPSSPTTRPVALEYEAEDCPSFMTSASDYSRLRGRGFPPAPKSRLVPAPVSCDFGGGDGTMFEPLPKRCQCRPIALVIRGRCACVIERLGDQLTGSIPPPRIMARHATIGAPFQPPSLTAFANSEPASARPVTPRRISTTQAMVNHAPVSPRSIP